MFTCSKYVNQFFFFKFSVTKVGKTLRIREKADKKIYYSSSLTLDIMVTDSLAKCNAYIEENCKKIQHCKIFCSLGAQNVHALFVKCLLFLYSDTNILLSIFINISHGARAHRGSGFFLLSRLHDRTQTHHTRLDSSV